MEISSTEYKKNNEISWPAFFNLAAINKNLFVYSATLLFTALALVFLLMPSIKGHLPFQALKIIYIFLMLIIGIGHIFIFPKWQADLYRAGIKDNLVYGLLLALFILAGDLVLFKLLNFPWFTWSFAGAAGFLLPSVIIASWKYFTAITEETLYDPWLLPSVNPERKVSLFLNSLPVQLKIKIRSYDLKEKNFLVTVPAHLKLGEMFHRFLVDNNESRAIPIQLYDVDGESFAWKFTLKRKFANKILDPKAGIIENRISKNNSILAERMPIIDKG